MNYDLDILKEEGYYGHVISKKLPKGLDNRLYTMLHLIGGLTTQDVAFFADQATLEEIKMLHKKVRQFPSQINEILPYAGSYKMLLNSPQYQEIIDMVKFGTHEEETVIEEQVNIDIDGFPTTDTNPYFTRYISPKLKEKLFKQWDSLGKADYDSLKLFGVVEDVDVDSSDFRNVGDVLYPVLALEWIGGVENTEFAKQGWETTSEGGWYHLKFKVEPIGYDYMFDESENFGEHGYACWDIRVLIDKNGDFDPPSEREDGETPYIQELFPESARNKLSSHQNYTEEQFEVIELLWGYYHDKASTYWSQFCNVEVVLV